MICSKHFGSWSTQSSLTHTGQSRIAPHSARSTGSSCRWELRHQVRLYKFEVTRYEKLNWFYRHSGCHDCHSFRLVHNQAQKLRRRRAISVSALCIRDLGRAAYCHGFVSICPRRRSLCRRWSLLLPPTETSMVLLGTELGSTIPDFYHHSRGLCVYILLCPIQIFWFY